MHTDLLPPSEPIMPWSRLVEAGWHISHLHHARLAGQTSLVVVMRKGNEHIFEQGPDLPAIWKKLEVQAKLEKRTSLPKVEKAPADPRHKEFIDAWHLAYTQHFQRPYTFNGAIDGKALKTFLGANDGKVSAIIQTARSAWDRQDQDPFCKACKHSTSVRGFCALWNEINAELTRDNRAQQTNGSNFRL